MANAEEVEGEVLAVTVAVGEAGWEDLEPVRGSIIEVCLDHTDGEFEEKGLTAIFLVVAVAVSPLRSCILEVKSLGTGNGAVDAQLSGRFNRRHGSLHLCTSKPCTEAELTDVLHVVKLKLWQIPWDAVTSLNAQQRRSVRRFLGLAEPTAELEEGGDLAGEEPGMKRPAARRSAPSGSRMKKPGEGEAKEKRERRGKVNKPTKKDKAKRKEAGDEDVPMVSREHLKERLAKLRERLTGTRGLVEEDFAEAFEENSGDSVVPVGSESPPEGLETGTSLVERSKKEPRRTKICGGSPKRTAAMRALEDTRGITSRLPQTQLVQQALAVNSGSNKEKKQRPGKTAHELAKILTRSLQKKSDKKERKEEKKKRRKEKLKKKRKKKGGKGSSDPSSSSGVTSSWEKSSNGSSDQDPEKSSSSEENYEAPLRKKAKNKPGSILSLLVEHARDQLDQSAMVGVSGKESKSVVDGVKLTSYFQILLKSKLTGAMAQQREMYHLAVCMDLLRQGKLSGVGDALAARFLCLHQSVLDGNWTAARHMELYPLEEASAAGTSIILRTRRHAKLAARAQGLEWGSYRGGFGRGRGGKGQYDGGGGDYGDHKGKKGKGKGKGRGAGKHQWWQTSGDKGKGDDWKEKQDGKQDK